MKGLRSNATRRARKLCERKRKLPRTCTAYGGVLVMHPRALATSMRGLSVKCYPPLPTSLPHFSPLTCSSLLQPKRPPFHPPASAQLPNANSLNDSSEHAVPQLFVHVDRAVVVTSDEQVDEPRIDAVCAVWLVGAFMSRPPLRTIRRQVLQHGHENARKASSAHPRADRHRG